MSNRFRSLLGTLRSDVDRLIRSERENGRRPDEIADDLRLFAEEIEDYAINLQGEADDMEDEHEDDEDNDW